MYCVTHKECTMHTYLLWNLGEGRELGCLVIDRVAIHSMAYVCI